MGFVARLFVIGVVAGLALPVSGQDLSPRAYVITPVGFNAITLTWSYFNGGGNFNGVVPVTGATGIYNFSIFTFYRCFSFFGRSANIAASLPYAVGNFQGQVQQEQRSVYRSGLVDFGVRFSVNLMGGPAMPAEKFAKWKQKVLLGASLKVVAPTGQYDPTKLVSWGINRWAFKPEFGYSEQWGNWLLDAYAGGWFYTTNQQSFSLPVPQPQTEKPIGALEGHLSRNFKFGPGASLDANYCGGDVASSSARQNLATKQSGSRIGGTVAWRFSTHQSLKVSYSNGTYVRFGGNYQAVQAAWQYSWLGWPKWR